MCFLVPSDQHRALLRVFKDAAATARPVGDQGKRRDDVHDASVAGDACLARSPRKSNHL
jgi:hypothetical protein